MMIDPRKVLVCTPAHDGRVEAAYAGGLMSIAAAHMMGNIKFLLLVSDVRLARNLLVDAFLKETAFDWLVFIDSDTGFSSKDFAYLMDYPARELAASDAPEINPEGTTLNSEGQAILVCAEYSRKVDNLDPVRFGLGFCRIHRSVFEILLAANDEADGMPRVGYFMNKGAQVADFFANGPGFDGHWFGEDTGFFHLCRLSKITPRIEQRTRLEHIGRKSYPYVGPAITIQNAPGSAAT